MIGLSPKNLNEKRWQERYDATFHRQIPSYQYVISQETKKYIVVSPETHHKVEAFAEQQQLKLIEATYRLLNLGLQAELGRDPREDPWNLAQVNKERKQTGSAKVTSGGDRVTIGRTFELAFNLTF